MKDLLPFEIDSKTNSIIKVIGVGGGGCNAVNYMFEKGITDVDFIVSNTDKQALSKSPIPVKIHLGQTLTEGLGAGNKPERGREAAIESLDDINAAFGDNTKMVFITAGMGGGTGTGAAPVIAEAAKKLGILTVGIVTIPFEFEGDLRINQAVEGVGEISKHVDALVVINNERLREIYGNLGLSETFSKADDVLKVAAKGIAEIITKEGHVNVDFADVNTVMKDSGVAIMGSAETEGEGRALKAIEEALNSPLLNNNDITGTKNILLNITHGEDELTGDELCEITNYAQNAAGKNANLIWGSNQDKSLGNKISVTIIATGFKTDIIPELYVNKRKKAIEKEMDKSKLEGDADNKYTKPNLFKKGDSVEWENPQKIVAYNTNGNKVEEVDFIGKTETITKDEEDDSNLNKALEKMLMIDKARKEKDFSNNKTSGYGSNKDIDDMENESALKRRSKNIHKNHTSVTIKEKNVSKYTLDDKNDLDIKPNSFLHDNVD